eukprot:2618931-Rhodomonas_salina.1
MQSAVVACRLVQQVLCNLCGNDLGHTVCRDCYANCVVVVTSNRAHAVTSIEHTVCRDHNFGKRPLSWQIAPAPSLWRKSPELAPAEGLLLLPPFMAALLPFMAALPPFMAA